MAAMSGMSALKNVLFQQCFTTPRALQSAFSRNSSPLNSCSDRSSSNSLSSVHPRQRLMQHPLTVSCIPAVHKSSFHSCVRNLCEKPTDTAPTATPDSKQSQDKKEEKKDDEKNGFFHKYGVWIGLGSMTLSFLSIGGHLYLSVWGPPAKDGDGNEIVDQFSHLPWWKAYMKRTMSEAHFFKKMIEEPSSKQLLPDPLQEPWYQPPYTLVLELTGVLLHPDWTMNTGWRFKKRPAVEYFLQQVGPPLFEVVLYTHEQGFTAAALVDGLDPNGYISFRLFRDATRYHNGVHVKDLDCLNRDLSKVIIVDCDPKAFELHKRNSIGLKKWTGNDDDRNLVDLAHFLKTIATSGVDDVRSVLDFYNESDDPLEAFKENQRRLQEELEQQQAMKAQEGEKKSLVGNWGSLGFSGRRG